MIVTLLIFFGLIPCIIVSLINATIFLGALLFFLHDGDFLGLLFIIMSPASLVGILFFVKSIRDVCLQRPWSKFNYITGGYGLIGAIIAIIIDKMVVSGMAGFEDGTIMPPLCYPPIIALTIAFLTRYKKSVNS